MTDYPLRFVAVGDIHLGRHRIPISEFQTRAMEQIVSIVCDVSPSVFFFAGDAFRISIPRAGDLAHFGQFLRAVADVCEVIMIPGNHDIAGRGATAIDVFDGYENVTVAKSPMMITRPGLQIACVPWLPSRALSGEGFGEKTSGAVEAILQLLHGHRDGRFCVLLAHCTTFTTFDSGAMASLSNDVLWTTDWFHWFDLCILGHIHRPHRAAENAFYTGSIVPLTFSEAGQHKKVLVYDGGEVSRIKLDVPMLHVVGADEMEDSYPGDFVRVVGDGADIKTPVAYYAEVVHNAPGRLSRTRLAAETAATMTAEDAVRAWLDAEGYKKEKGEVLKMMASLEGE